MRDGGGSAVAEPLRRLWTGGSMAGVGDATLLARFAEEGNERAFEAIVARHGPTVLGVCRRMLRDGHDAEDAFQAVFLVLARRAGRLQDAERLGAWLYGVAVRTARKARRAREIRQAREESAAGPVSSGSNPSDQIDLGPVLDEELARLPARLREPLVLCLVEGHGRSEAARRLGLPEGTLSSRLARGRATLGRRLAQRGIAPGVLATGLGLTGTMARAALPVALARLAIQAAGFVRGTALLRPGAALLVQGGSPGMIAMKLTLGGALMVGLAAALPGRTGTGGPGAPETPVSTGAPEPEPLVLGRLVVRGENRSRDGLVRKAAEQSGLVPGRPITRAALASFKARLADEVNPRPVEREASIQGEWLFESVEHGDARDRKNLEADRLSIQTEPEAIDLSRLLVEGDAVTADRGEDRRELGRLSRDPSGEEDRYVATLALGRTWPPSRSRLRVEGDRLTVRVDPPIGPSNARLPQGMTLRYHRRPKIEGRWVAVGETDEGQWLPILNRSTGLDLLGLKAWVRDGAEVAKARVRLDQEGDPEALDLIGSDGEGGSRTLRYRYRLRGETLLICMASRPEERPAEFGSTRRNGQTVLAFRRLGVEGKPPTPTRDDLPRGFGRSARVAERLRAETGLTVEPHQQAVPGTEPEASVRCLRVLAVEEGSPAARAGLRVEDRLMTLGYGPLRSVRPTGSQEIEIPEHTIMAHRADDVVHVLDAARKQDERWVDVDALRGEPLERQRLRLRVPDQAEGDVRLMPSVEAREVPRAETDR